jgi:hypothetical protein
MPDLSALAESELDKPVLDTLPGEELPACFGHVPQGACLVPLDGLLPRDIAARLFERRIQIARVGDPFKTVKTTEFRVSFRVPRGFPPPVTRLLSFPASQSILPNNLKKSLVRLARGSPYARFPAF